MNPPPPMLPALGSVTASANAGRDRRVDGVASLGEHRRARRRTAGADVQTTIPSFDEHASPPPAAHLRQR